MDIPLNEMQDQERAASIQSASAFQSATIALANHSAYGQALKDIGKAKKSWEKLRARAADWRSAALQAPAGEVDDSWTDALRDMIGRAQDARAALDVQQGKVTDDLAKHFVIKFPGQRGPVSRGQVSTSKAAAAVDSGKVGFDWTSLLLPAAVVGGAIVLVKVVL